MRRTLLLCAVLAIGCESQHVPPADSATPAMNATPPAPTPITLAEVAGTWEGTITAAGNDTVLVNQTLVAMPDTTGWTLTIANAKTPTKTQVVKLTHVMVSGDSVTAEAGPFESVLRAGQKITTHAIYRLKEGKLVGTLHVMYPNNEMVMMSSVASRKM